MRIDRLNFIAYGPFSNVSLDLSGGTRGLHIIHGPNEAGKSTSMRALRGWLFGFPTRLGDDHQHSYQSLRVGGVIRDENGETFETIRRKANKQALRLADDKTLADEDLLKGALLGGITQDDFEAMLTIDSESLSEGGEAALKTGGKLAELIFGSGLDLAALRRFQKSLEVEIESLFKPTGQNPSINQTLRLLDEKRKEIEAASIKGADFTAKLSELTELREQLKKLDQEWRRIRFDRDRLNRIAQARPDLARRKTLKTELTDFANAPRLADDFPERRRRAEEDKVAASARKSTQAAEFQRIKFAIETIPPASSILDVADEVDAIQTDLGGEKVAAQNRSKQQKQRADHLKTAASLLAELGRDESPEIAMAPRIKTGLKSKLSTLADQWTKLNADRDSTRRAVASAQKKLDDASKKLESWPTPKNTDGLQRTLKRTRNVAESSESSEAASRELDKIERQAKTLRAKLGELPGTLDEIVTWPVPPLEILERYRDKLHSAETALEFARSEYNRSEDSLGELRKLIERQRQKSDVPDLAVLDARRAKRNAGWRLVKADWLGPKADAETLRTFLSDEPAASLSETFEGAFRSADEVADRLRLSADEVATRAGYLADQSHLVELLIVLKTRRSEAEESLDALLGRWAAVWFGVPLSPRTPREMIAWANAHSALVEKVEQITESRKNFEVIEAERASAVTDLKREFFALEEEFFEREDLAAIRDRANALLAKWQAETSKKTRAEEDRNKLAHEVAAASERLAEYDEQIAAWKKTWALAIEPLGLGSEVTPSEAMSVLEASLELAKSLEQASRIASEILDAEAVTIRFQERLSSLLTVHLPGTSSNPPEQATTSLKLLLVAARATEEQRKTLVGSCEEAERAIQTANESLERSRLALESLATEAGIDRIEELAAIERLALDRAERERELRAVEDRLVAIAPDILPDDLDSESRTISPEDLELSRSTIEEDFERIDRERHQLSNQIGQKDQEIRSMESTAKEAIAELAATEREHLMGVLEVDVERYVHLRLSLAVLNGAIEEYRNQNEAPVLRMASEHFARFTLGSFAGLRAELDDKNDPVLFGVRSDGTSLVAVSGMSLGTVDQLYLAMKLASIEHYFQSRPPLPLIVDDILIQFDDARAVAALEALADLSTKMQVLFFTHHEHLVKLATERISPDVLFVHRLASRRELVAASANSGC